MQKHHIAVIAGVLLCLFSIYNDFLPGYLVGAGLVGFALKASEQNGAV